MHINSLEAVRLIDALIDAGADLQRLEFLKRNVLLFACEAGVDPMIFDPILNWNPRRKNYLGKWWKHFDFCGDGAFVLACNSGNFDLAEHVFNVALTAVNPTSFLAGQPNNILKALSVAVEEFDEIAALKLLNMCHKVIDKIPGKRFIFLSDLGLSDLLSRALDKGMFKIILTCYALFPTEGIKQFILYWHQKCIRVNNAVPMGIGKLVHSIRRKALWENNRDLALVLVRAYKNKNMSCGDILEHISSYVHSVPFTHYDFYFKHDDDDHYTESDSDGDYYYYN